MGLTTAQAEALRAVRAACANNREALIWLEEVEWALEDRMLGQLELDAWNKWAAQ